jgi:hypothetical protein
MVFGDYRPVDQVIQEIHDVDEDAVGAYLDRHFAGQRFSFLGVGDLEAKPANDLLAKVKNWT